MSTGSGRPDGCICDYNPDTTQGPEEDCPVHGRPYAYWVEGCQQLGELLKAERASADAAEAKVASAHVLLSEMVDSDPCWFDHNGGCQAHGYLSLKPGETCPQQDVKDLLKTN